MSLIASSRENNAAKTGPPLPIRRQRSGSTAFISEEREFELAVDCLVDQDPHVVHATINRVRNGVFELCFPIPLMPGQQMSMRHLERTIESQVAYCKRQENGSYTIGVLMACDADRRSETRSPVDLPAVLRLADSRTLIPVRVIDLSTSGLGLELSMSIPVGVSAYVDLKTGTAVGEIRHCKRTSERFRAGIRMREFLLPSNGQRALLNTTSETGCAAALQSLMRTVQERQSRYEAILYSLALP
jgi:hypothetical protein